MPALTMRGRYLMREYWQDADLHLKLTAEERELYIGLWMLADDAGWMPRDIEEVGAALFRYQDRESRSSRVRKGLEHLGALGKVRSHRCCLHLPAVERYPRAGKKSREHEIAHRFHAQSIKRPSNGSIDIQTDLNPSPVPSLPGPSRRGAHARGSEEPTTKMSDAMVSAGGFAAELVKP